MLIAPLLLSAALRPAPSSTEAYTGAPPVQVASCSVEAPASIPGSYFGPIVPTIGSLNISFVNRIAKPIMKVEFAVSNGTTTVPVVDEGTFSTGIPINHTFPEPALTGSDVSCAVHSVVFADGSTWPAQRAQIGEQ
jgi:hypothetical protein